MQGWICLRYHRAWASTTREESGKSGSLRAVAREGWKESQCGELHGLPVSIPQGRNLQLLRPLRLCGLQQAGWACSDHVLEHGVNMYVLGKHKRKVEVGRA